MKSAKSLMVLLLAIAAMAWFGGAEASASVLCKVATSTSCGSTNDYPSGTEIRGKLVLGSHLVIENGSGTILEVCEGSKLQGTTTNTGSAVESVRWDIAAFSFESCETEGFTGLVVTKLGSIAIQKIGGSNNGTLTAEGFEFSSEGGFCQSGVTAGSEVGTLTQSAGSSTPARIDLHMKAPKTGGFFNCPEVVITATYEVEAPVPLYVAAS